MYDDWILGPLGKLIGFTVKGFRVLSVEGLM